MSLLVHIDNEVRGLPGQWDAVVQNGSSTIVQTPDAAFPGRGRMGLRASTPGANTAYVQLNPATAISAGETIAYSLWLRLNTLPDTNADSFVAGHAGGSVHDLTCLTKAIAGVARMALRSRRAGGYANTAYAGNLAVGRWHHIAVLATRASADLMPTPDGEGLLYLDGALAGTNPSLDNFDELAQLQALLVGSALTARAGNSWDIDEVKIGTTLADVRPTPGVHRDINRYPDFRPVQADTRLRSPKR